MSKQPMNAVDGSQAAAGAAAYSKPALMIYDLFVFGFSSTYAWKCPSTTLLGA